MALLERRTVRQVGDVLHRLSDPEQDRLVTAMRDGRADDRGRTRCRGPRSSCASPGPAISAGWSPATPTLYAEEYGWGENFEGLCAQIVADFVAKYDPARERCWIAEMDGENVGSVFLVKDTDKVARLRLLLVDPVARGRGARHAADRRMRPLRQGVRLSQHHALDPQRAHRRASHLQQVRASR